MSNGAVPAQTKRLVGCFPSSGIHAQNYRVADIPAGQLSHVIYASADDTRRGLNFQRHPLRARRSGQKKRQ
jgi:hypothetical protein